MPLLVIVIVVSFSKQVYANWPMPAYIGALLVSTHLLSERKWPLSHAKKTIALAVATSFLVTIIAYGPFFGISYGISGAFLPTKKIVGWREMGERLQQISSERFPSDSELPFVLADGYGSASAIAFYFRRHRGVFCDNLGGRRMNQYDIWGGWEKLQGADAIIVIDSANSLEQIRGKFASVEENL